MSIAFFDTESFPNYWLLKIKVDGAFFTFCILDNEILSDLNRSSIQQLFSTHTVVSFNGMRYDTPMIAVAMGGGNCQQLKRVSDQLIVYKRMPWQLKLPKWGPYDHIDLLNVIPGQGSQKQFAGRIHYPKLQDLPFDPNIPLTPQQIKEVDNYCELDVCVLEALYHEMGPQLEQRRAMGMRYGLDLRSKSDAQLAETVIKYRCEHVTGQPIPKPTPPNLTTQFQYTAPSFIRFEHPQLQEAKRIIESIQFTYALDMPEQLKKLTVTLGSTTYALGIGGLHSQEQSLTVYSTDAELLRDADVASYYPQLILNSQQYPPAIGPAFQHVYQSIKDERLVAKAEEKRTKSKEAKILNNGLKIQINGTFGKMGSPYSIMFAPEMLTYTTITGQLSLLMLIEWHESAGIPVVSANTDGFVTRCPRERIQESDLLIKAWEMQTGLRMEITEYQSIHLRDVNSYIAITTKGDVKRKGKFGPSGLTQMKNPDTEICTDAVIAYLQHNTPIEYTVASCRDIRKFIKIQKVKGGAIKNNQYLGQVVRWYYGINSPAPITYQTNGNKVGRSEGAIPCLTLPDTFPSNIDYSWYINEAQSLLTTLSKEGNITQQSLFT